MKKIYSMKKIWTRKKIGTDTIFPAKQHIEKWCLSHFLIGILCLCFLSIFQALASPEMMKLTSELVWRSDGQGDYLFNANDVTRGVKIAADGAVEYVSAPGTYELTSPYLADGLIVNLTANWTFTGKVTLEISVTGKPEDYIAITNGVPYQFKSNFGSRIRWRAALADKSKLNEVRITYKDITGTLGSWGNPKLGAFGFRKAIFINGSDSGELFNYQVPVKVGESGAENCDLTLKAVTLADFQDVRFTQADGQTCLPYYLEEISSPESKKRVALFWIKVPQIPVTGLPIHIYYGRPGVKGLSTGKDTFDFYDDFSEPGSPDPIVWQAFDLKQGVLEYKLKAEKEIKTLDTPKLTKEEIINFFTADTGFEWARVRTSSSPMPSVNREKTAAVSEEVPFLPDFSGIDVAPNGDLTLAQGSSRGQYTSINIRLPFKARIMVPEYNAIVTKGALASIDISANGGKDFNANCVTEKYYYASKKDFSAGDSLQWRLRLSGEDPSDLSGRLKEFSLDYRPGVISIIAPETKEELSGGSKYNVKWSAQEYEPSYAMGIAYSLDDGKKYSVITEETLNTGVYLWKVPKEADKKVLLKVYDKASPAIYATSEGYFSGAEKTGGIGDGAGEEAAGLPESEADAMARRAKEAQDARAKEAVELGYKNDVPEGKQLYELAVMTRDNTLSNQKEDIGSYKKGDVVVIMPAGHNWSETEKTSFFITQAYLTKEEAARLLQPKVVTKGVDKDGKPIHEVTARRKLRVNLNKQGIIQDKEKRQWESSEDKPMLKFEAVEDKEAKK